MWISGKKNSRFARQKKNILTLVLSGKKILNETKNPLSKMVGPLEDMRKTNGNSLSYATEAEIIAASDLFEIDILYKLKSTIF